MESALEAAINEWHASVSGGDLERSARAVSERLMVVEQDATWPESKGPSRVATVFRVTGERVTAALRLPNLKSALELAYICREMAATE